MVDYHVHPDYSPDASGAMREHCAAALARGVTELCFTTHYEPDPARAGREAVVVRGVRQPVASDWPISYFSDVEQCRREFPALAVLAGVEVGYEPRLEGLTAEFLGRHPFDFVLGAVHCLDGVAITASDELDEFRREYLPRGAEFIAERYFGHLRAAAESGLFDALAHIDIYRKYVAALLGAELAETAKNEMDATLGVIARTGTGIEVNTSAQRRGQGESYPDMTIVARAQALGVRVFTVGSDAHCPDDVGAGIKEAVKLLGSLGIAPARFRLRQRL